MVDILDRRMVAQVIHTQQDFLKPDEVETLSTIAARLLDVRDARIAQKKAARNIRVRGYYINVVC